MKQYLDLLRDVRTNGVLKPTRAKLLSTGQYVDALSVFGRQMRFDLSQGFPIVTSKSVDFNAVAHELIWFLRGDTNTKYLTDNGVNIWRQWVNENDEVEHSYPECWRSFGDLAGYTHVDQIANLVKWIKETRDNPRASVGRRLVLSAWNPLTVEYASLPPCHVMAIFNVTNGVLSCMMTMRSADIFLGVPYNISSYALLTELLAHVTGLAAGDLVMSFADVHAYQNHLDQIDEQLTREPWPHPTLSINPSLNSIDEVSIESLDLQYYACHGSLRAEVAV